jgi:pimeloyl-ACP methyl ester carboxylesterase
VHISWVSPERGESVEHYAQKISATIKDELPIIVGLSFGGMVAVEIAKQRPTKKVILLSSVKTASEVPIYFKLLRVLPIHRILPFKSLLWAFYWLAYWLFSPESTEQKQLLRTILMDTDPHFLKWALHRVVVWRNQEVPETVVQVHGQRDRIFPYRWVKPNYTVENSGHLMVMTRAAEISSLIEKLTLQSEMIESFKNKDLDRQET